MSIDKDLAAWQVLGVAIRSEIDAAAFYTRLQGRVKNLLLVQKLKSITGRSSSACSARGIPTSPRTFPKLR